MNYMTTKEIAEKWGISDRRILQYCNARRIPGVVKKGNLWLIPADTEKPKDGRYKYNDREDEKMNNKMWNVYFLCFILLISKSIAHLRTEKFLSLFRM